MTNLLTAHKADVNDTRRACISSRDRFAAQNKTVAPDRKRKTVGESRIRLSNRLGGVATREAGRRTVSRAL